MLLKKISTVLFPGIDVMHIRIEPIHEINAISRFAVGFEVQEYRRFADVASWVLHDGDHANLLKQQEKV